MILFSILWLIIGLFSTIWLIKMVYHFEEIKISNILAFLFGISMGGFTLLFVMITLPEYVNVSKLDLVLWRRK